MDKDLRKARKLSGLARFERTKKGWKIPGTQAAGMHHMLQRRCWDILRQLRNTPEECHECGGMGHTVGFLGKTKQEYPCESC